LTSIANAPPLTAFSTSAIQSLLKNAYSQNYVYLIKQPDDQYQVILEVKDNEPRNREILTIYMCGAIAAARLAKAAPGQQHRHYDRIERRSGSIACRNIDKSGRWSASREPLRSIHQRHD